MPANITPLIYLILIGLSAFTYMKLTIGSVIDYKDFRVWTITWLTLTTLVFVSKNFLLYILLSFFVIYFANKAAKNKLALYAILLLLMPPYLAKLSVFITITHLREISLLILLPIFFSIKPRNDLPRFGKSLVDKLVVAFLIIRGLLMIRGLDEPVDPFSGSEVIRQMFYIGIEMFLPYYVASRYIKNFDELKTVMIAFLTAIMIAGMVGIFEIGTSWRLYGDLYRFLGIYDWNLAEYLGRSGFIRASASLEHPLSLGFIMLIGCGSFLFISNLVKNKLYMLAGFILLAAGLLSPISRGSWVGAALMVFVFLIIGHKKGRNFTLFVMAVIASIPVLSFTKFGNKFLDLLPFFGKTETFNVDYRTRLFDQSLLVIQNNPSFGLFDPLRAPELQTLIQGQGIIDLVNFYLEMALYNGVIGLVLFVGAALTLTLKLLVHLGQIQDKTSMHYICGKALFATFLGMLVTISTLSGVTIINAVIYFMMGIIISYIRVTKRSNLVNNDIDKESDDDRNLTVHDYPTSRVVKDV